MLLILFTVCDLNNNNKLYTLLNKSIEISPGKLPLCTRQRGDFPCLNTPFVHLFLSVTIELVKLHY